MSQIPRRATTLSMSQPPKVRKTPTVSPTASQPIVTKRQQQEATDIPVKTIEVETPIVIEDTDFGDSMENHNLVQVLSSVEEKNGLTQKNNEAKTPTNEEKKSVKESPGGSPTTNGSGKASKRSKAKRSFANDGVQDVAVDDTQSSSTSIRSSVDSSAPVEMESLLIPEDEDLAESPSEKSVSSYDSPRPNKTPGSTKVVRLTKGMRLSPFRKVDQAALDNVSTIVNLSTVSEQSIENNLDSPVVPSATETKNGATPDAQDDTEATNNSDASGASSRRITARRTYASNRPLREMSFRNATREAYRKNGTGTPSEENSNEEAVNDSVNATVGSELGLHMDDLPETPAVGQKRRRDSSDAEDDAAPEPKKSLFQTYCAIM